MADKNYLRKGTKVLQEVWYFLKRMRSILMVFEFLG